MTYYNRFLKPILHTLPAEAAHNAAVKALRTGSIPKQKIEPHAMLAQTISGMSFAHPVGLAAGFDKNAEAIFGLSQQGFSFVEAGTVTPLEQKGNPKPRLFRLPKDKAVINRMGFNNKGLDVFESNFAKHKPNIEIVVGANIGKNKDAPNDSSDYLKGMERMLPIADYITVNISSPNTQGLRDMQARDSLTELLSDIQSCKQQFASTTPIWLKLAPDMSDSELSDACAIAQQYQMDALIISNTTIGRRNRLVDQKRAQEQGGLSGRPLFGLATSVLRQTRRHTKGSIPLIGVGGISNAGDAYTKIKAGASLVQLYTALIYDGMGVVKDIVNTLPTLIGQDGFEHISQATGCDC